jgi:acetoin utilization deacetylase AcuC-like enzyme
MHIFYSTQHHLHSPEFEIFNGERTPHSEIPSRVDNILEAVRDTGYQVSGVGSFTDEPVILENLRQIHDPQYLSWLQSTKVSAALYPSVFNHLPNQILSGSLSIQWGNFVTDLFTPLLPHTYQAALLAIQTVHTAAHQLHDHQETTVALVRPPGHHAGRSRVGGYCYLNNAAYAAHVLSEHGRVAVLDVDFHHGNGTQDIFYDRSDVITCSIHADPVRKFPYFAGFANELGQGEGKNCNRNFSLAAGITDDQYQQVLQEALNWIRAKNPNFLVISLGLDTHESDPICDFKLTTQYYQHMAHAINLLGVPVIVILEGGYSTAAIGENMVSFLAGI